MGLFSKLKNKVCGEPACSEFEQGVESACLQLWPMLANWLEGECQEFDPDNKEIRAFVDYLHRSLDHDFMEVSD